MPRRGERVLQAVLKAVAIDVAVDAVGGRRGRAEYAKRYRDERAGKRWKQFHAVTVRRFDNGRIGSYIVG